MNLIKRSQALYVSADGKNEILLKTSGLKVDEKGFVRGPFRFSSKHAAMMPHRECFNVLINGKVKATDLFEDEVWAFLKKLGFYR